MQKRVIAVVLILTAVLLTVGLFPVHGEAKIYESVVRLHVLANSDSEEDQARKLKVRDAILEITAPLLDGCPDRDAAEMLLREHEADILAAAHEALISDGRDEAVSILFGTESYPERSYDSFCFPAGEYLSMRVCIGAAAGKNWWCCLYPPLCLGAASVSRDKAEEEFISVGLTPSQYRVITETDRPVYRARFKLLELFRNLR